MKTKLTTLLALVAGFFANNTASAQDLTVTFDATVASKYVFRGVQLGDLTIHPSVQLEMDDYYISVWAALPQENRGSPDFFDDEIDIVFGRGMALNDSTALDFGLTVYTYPNAENTAEAFLGVTHEMENGFSVGLTGFRDFDLDTFTVEASGGYSVYLSDIASLDIGGYIGTVQDDDAGDPDYTYYGVDLVVPIQLNDNTVLSLGAHYADHDDSSLGEDSHFFGTASVTYGF